MAKIAEEKKKNETAAKEKEKAQHFNKIAYHKKPHKGGHSSHKRGRHLAAAPTPAVKPEKTEDKKDTKVTTTKTAETTTKGDAPKKGSKKVASKGKVI